MTDEKSKAENTFHKKIGKTNYKVTVHFSETSNETITDKINRLIQKECEDMSKKEPETKFRLHIICYSAISAYSKCQIPSDV